MLCRSVYFSPEVTHQRYWMIFNQARSHGVAWSDKCQPGATWCQLFATPGNFFAIVYCCFILVAAKERSPEIVFELSIGLYDTLERSIFSSMHVNNLIVTV